MNDESEVKSVEDASISPDHNEKPGLARKDQKTTKILAAQEKQEKYYKQFDFFFNRSCFRIMTEFYKEKFNKFYNAEMIILKKN